MKDCILLKRHNTTGEEKEKEEGAVETDFTLLMFGRTKKSCGKKWSLERMEGEGEGGFSLDFISHNLILMLVGNRLN